MKVEGLPALEKQLGVFALKAGGGAELGPESPFSLVVITFPFYLHFVGPLRAEENLSEWQNPSIKEAALPGFARPSLSQLLINLHTVKNHLQNCERVKARLLLLSASRYLLYPFIHHEIHFCHNQSSGSLPRVSLSQSTVMKNANASPGKKLCR